MEGVKEEREAYSQSRTYETAQDGALRTFGKQRGVPVSGYEFLSFQLRAPSYETLKHH